MCARCGCLTSAEAAPEDGTYKCMECEKAGKSDSALPIHVIVKKGDIMPTCTACSSSETHWVRYIT